MVFFLEKSRPGLLRKNQFRHLFINKTMICQIARNSTVWAKIFDEFKMVFGFHANVQVEILIYFFALIFGKTARFHSVRISPNNNIWYQSYQMLHVDLNFSIHISGCLFINCSSLSSTILLAFLLILIGFWEQVNERMSECMCVCMHACVLFLVL